MLKGLFLGAGASYELGMPLVWELTGEIKRALLPDRLFKFNEGWISQGGGHSKKTIDLISKLLTNDFLHYENVIGALEVAIRRERNNEQSQDLHGLKEWVLDLIYELLLERQLRNIHYVKGGLKFLSGLRVLAESSHPLWVFSLNHDLNLELNAAEYKIPIRSGFPGTIQIPHLGTENFLNFEYIKREELENRKYNFFQHKEYGINLVKLHGSLDIFAKDDQHNFLKIIPKEISPEGYVNALHYLNRVFPKKNFIKATNHIVFDDKVHEIDFLRKTILSGAHKFEDRSDQIAPQELLGSFRTNLNYVTDLTVIGYSFSDHHINSIIRDWLAWDEKRNITIVSPMASIPQALAYMASQLRTVKKSCIEYFLDIENRKLSFRENVFLNTRSFIRRRTQSRISQGKW